MELEGFRWNSAYLLPGFIGKNACDTLHNGVESEQTHKETMEDVLMTIDCDTLPVGAVGRRYGAFLVVSRCLTYSRLYRHRQMPLFVHGVGLS